VSGALLITLTSLVVGGALAVATSRGHALLDVLRTFAVVAVATLAAVQLLPEAVASLGAWALLLFVLALALPPSLTWLWGRLAPSPERMSARGVGAELGYFGFVAHQFVEGLALGTYTGPLHDDHDHGGLVLAVAAHTVPLTALFIGTVLKRRGTRPALRRLVALLLASGLGFAAAGWVATSFTETVAPTLAALVAGFLCHVLLHRHDVAPARGLGLRALELVAVLAGAALPLAAMHDHGDLQHALLDAWLELALVTAPLVLLGLVLAAIVQGRAVPTLASWLQRRGAAAGLATAFAIFGPQLGAESLSLTVGLLGWRWALVRIAAALVIAMAVGIVLARTSTHVPVVAPAEAAPTRGRLHEAMHRFDRLLLESAPWTVVGLLAAAYLAIAFPPGSLATLTGGHLDLLAVGLLAIPIYVGAASATPIAAVLLVAGVSPAAVLLGLLLGPATNVATLASIARDHGWRAAGLAVLATAVLAGGLGLALGLLPLPTPASLATHHEHGPLAWGSLVVLLALLGGQLWRWGLGPWLEILDAGAHLHGGDHAHGHDHDHDHHHHAH
jgi:uncharacterized protein